MRLLVLLLVLAHLGYHTWREGHWLAWGGARSWADPQPWREPQRLDNQLQPERLTVVRPAPQAAASAAAPSESQSAPPPTCQQTALPGGDEQASALAAALQAAPTTALAEGSWRIDTRVQPARWVVYLGKFSSAEALRARKAELRAAKIDHRDVSNPALQPGLALGTFPTQAAATQALKDVVRNGVRSARVVVERPETRQHTLQLPAATPALLEAVQSLSAGLTDVPAWAWEACDE